MARIVFELEIDAPAAAVVSALDTAEGIAGWWTGDVDFAGGEGSIMTVGFPVAPKPLAQADEVRHLLEVPGLDHEGERQLRDLALLAEGGHELHVGEGKEASGMRFVQRPMVAPWCTSTTTAGRLTTDRSRVPR